MKKVVRFYNTGGINHPGLDPLMHPLGLADAEIRHLGAFLRSLTGDNIEELLADAHSIPIRN